MSVTQTFDLIRQYATAMGQPGDLMVEVLTHVSDEHSIPLKVYGGDLDSHAEPRHVLDVQTITMTNVMGVAKRQLSIEPGVTLLYGPNGSGKTTAMRTMLFALFGAAAAGVRTAEDLIAQGQSLMEASVTFAGGKVLRSVNRKTISRGKNAGQLDTEHYLGVEIAGDKANKPKPAQALIDGWMGVDGDFVRRVCCLEQGMLTQIMDEQPARRRELFFRMLALEPAEETRKSLAKALDVEEGRRAKQQETGVQLDAELKALRHRFAGFSVVQMETERDRLMPLAQAASVDPAALKDAREALARRELDKINGQREAQKRKEYLGTLEDLKRDPALTMTFVDRSLDIAKCERIVNSSRAEYINWSRQLAGLKARGETVKSLPPECPTCAAIGKKCEVTQDVKEKALVALRTEYTTASRALAECKDTGEKYSTSLRELQAADKQDAANKSRAAFVAEQIKLLNEGLANQPELEDFATLEADIKRLSESIKLRESAGNPKILADLRAIDAALADALSVEAQIASVVGKIAANDSQPLMGNEHLEAFRFAVKAFAKDGLPLYLARQHLERVNTIAEEICTLDKYKYRFGANLEVEIYGDGELVMGPELACGSARERGAVVLMAALGRYLQELSGLSIPFLWVDELPFQDEANSGLIVDMMKKLTKWYPKVVLCASRWDEFLGQFDHEIGLTPEDLSIELDRQRQAQVGGISKVVKAPQTESPSKAAQFTAEVQQALRPAGKQDSTELATAITKAAKKSAANAPVEAKAERLPMRQHVALCADHAKLVDITKVAVIESQPFQCVGCLKEKAAESIEPPRDALAEAEAALSEVPKMDADMGGECPF